MAIEDVSDDELKNSYYESLVAYDDALKIMEELIVILDGREREKNAFEAELKKRNITVKNNE